MVPAAAVENIRPAFLPVIVWAVPLAALDPKGWQAVDESACAAHVYDPASHSRSVFHGNAITASFLYAQRFASPAAKSRATRNEERRFLLSECMRLLALMHTLEVI